ncbi:MAG: hypothetical protein QG588_461, partial [Candidatus Poribacteria bacterium]|nr:hypothetical protein [Candidatus Poribacteria bacterium]
KKMNVSADYQAHLAFYDRYNHQNQRDHTGTWNIETKPVNQLSIGLRGQERYSSLKSDERQPLLAGNTIKFNDFSLTPYIEQKIGERLKVAFSYTFTERKNKQEGEDLEGSKTYKGTADVQYKLNRSFSIDGGYNYSLDNFTETTSDHTEQVTNVGFTWNMRPRIRIRGKYGHTWEVVESGKRIDRPIMSSTVDLNPGKNTVATITYTESSSHSSSHDTENASFISHDASLTIKHDLLSRKVTLNYGGAYNLSDYDSVDRVDKSYNGTVNIDWKMFNSILLFLDGSYKRSWYIHDLEQRRDKSCGGGGGLKLKISRSTDLSLSGNYTKSQYQPDSYQVELYEGSVILMCSIGKNIIFEAGYQYVESVSTELELQNYKEDNNNYLKKRYSAGLKTTF